MGTSPATPAPATATLLLPASGRCLQPLPRSFAAALARADRLSDGLAGIRAQVLRHFAITPRGWPIAALTREFDAGDADRSAWLRADPAWIRPDINGARMLACGERLQPTHADIDAFLPALRPVFGDAGFAFDAPAPARWYLCLPPGSPIPSFMDPTDVVGADFFDHLPGGGQMDDASARRWRSLMSDVQVVLHNHPWNGRRAAMGKPPINSLWFWGGGVMPDTVTAGQATVWSDDPLVRAFASVAKATTTDLPERFTRPGNDVLIDLRGTGPEALHDRWLAPAIDAVRRRRLAGVQLDCLDGFRLELVSAHRWRFWRKPRSFVRSAGDVE